MKYKTCFCFLAVILAVFFTSSLFASNGTQIGTVGARSTAMGSNFRGLADDWSAVYHNPAGLTQLGKWSVGISVGLIMPKGDYTPVNYPTSPPILPFTGMATGEVNLVEKTFAVPALNIIHKVNEKLAVGLGVYAPFGLGTEFDIFSVPSNYNTTAPDIKENESFSDHQVINIQPTIAYQVTEKLSLGLGVSYIMGSMILDQLKLPMNPLLNPAFAQIPGWPTTPMDPDQYRLIVENKLDGDGNAFGFNAGALYKISEKFSIGVSGRYATDLALEGTMKQTLYGPTADPTKAAIINALPAATFADDSDPTGEANKQMVLAVAGGQNVPMEYDVKADMPLPWTVGLGIAYKPLQKLTLTADGSLTNWSSWGDIVVEIEGGENQSLKQDWENTIELGMGAEYLAIDKDNMKLHLRGGFYTVDTPAPNETMSPSILDPARRYVITGGLGVKLGLIKFNVCYEHVMFDENDISQSEYIFDDRGIADNFAGLYKFNAGVLTFGAIIDL